VQGDSCPFAARNRPTQGDQSSPEHSLNTAHFRCLTLVLAYGAAMTPALSSTRLSQSSGYCGSLPGMVAIPTDQDVEVTTCLGCNLLRSLANTVQRVKVQLNRLWFRPILVVNSGGDDVFDNSFKLGEITSSEQKCCTCLV